VARLVAGREGRVQDLSQSGARLEHEVVLLPGEPCPLRFGLNDELFTFSSRVVWSRAVGRAGALLGRLPFESGLAFVRVPAAAKPLLAQLLAPPRSRVLLVDDERALRESLGAWLKKAGYEVHEAADGCEGLEKARRLVPDLIFLDVRMPGVDGYEICQALKENPGTTRIPVVFLTAVDDPGLHRRACEAGGTACLTKPFRMEVVTALTHTVIENASR
jgi:CheY-like chemotaxis protein